MTEAELRLAMCDIGQRLYARQLCAANDGNLSCRLDGDRILCTPTLMCKGFLQPDDLCLVDYEGNQLTGKRSRTSEILLHLSVYRHRSDIQAVVHCHAPHASAFAVTRQPVPMGIMPEADVFLTHVPVAPYAAPGNQRFADTILPYLPHTNVILLANHGVISFGPDLERAYWLSEILDAYCRILILAKTLGTVVELSAEEQQELAELKKVWMNP
ncbi:MAG TPA: class II aldolase/adducin family protein [Pirellulaceae bacterium]|nr:class II aldolase/adducin family protein [Pirellulaceae bacterium]